MYLCVNIIFEILYVWRHSYFLFTAPSAAALPPVNCPCVPQLEIRLSTSLLCTSSNTNYQNLVLVAEYHDDCWQALQCRLLWRISGATNCKSKQVKKEWHGKFYLQSVWAMGKTGYFEHRNIKICGWITKLEATKNAICVRFLPHLQKIWIYNFPRYSVARYLRWAIGSGVWVLYKFRTLSS